MRLGQACLRGQHLDCTWYGEREEDRLRRKVTHQDRQLTRRGGHMFVNYGLHINAPIGRTTLIRGGRCGKHRLQSGATRDKPRGRLRCRSSSE